MESVSRAGTPPAEQDAVEAGAECDLSPIAKKARTEASERDPYYEFFKKHSPSVVTVAVMVNTSQETHYGTGFILISDYDCTVVFASNTEMLFGYKDKYYIYFENDVKIEADWVAGKGNFLVLVAKDDKERLAVNFSKDPVKHERVTTIGSMGGAKLHANTLVLHTLMGVLGNHVGNVSTESCLSKDAYGIPLKGSGKYFRVECSMLDQIVTLENVDEVEEHTAYQITSSPVFRLTTGEVVGLIFSKSDWVDVKIGLHSADIISYLDGIFGTTWKNGVMKTARRRLGTA